jgi:hypothetical protein
MDKSVERKMTEFMRPIFGDMAGRTIDNQKLKLELARGELSYEQYVRIVESIFQLCQKMAGVAIASRVQKGLMEILDAERA